MLPTLLLKGCWGERFLSISRLSSPSFWHHMQCFTLAKIFGRTGDLNPHFRAQQNWLPEFFMPQCTCQGSDGLKALIQSPPAAQPRQLQPPSLKKSLLQSLSLRHLILLKKHILSQKESQCKVQPHVPGPYTLPMARLVCRVAEAWSNL